MQERIGKIKYRYTVYDNTTDFPVIVCGTSQECAKAMGVSVGYFWKCIAGKYGDKWHIIKYIEKGGS